jgi:hypothetical protein
MNNFLKLEPQPDRKPFQIEGEKYGKWFNETRRCFKNPKRYPLEFISWSPPLPGMVPVKYDGFWIWLHPGERIGNESEKNNSTPEPI